MERAIGEVFDYNGVTLITIENNSCEGCFFNDGNICTRETELIFCSAGYRNDNKNVIFKKMEERTVKLTLEKAKKFYEKGGEFKDLALSAFTEKELVKVELPKTWEEFCSQSEIYREYYIDIDSSVKETDNDCRDPLYDKNVLPSKKAAEQYLALMQLHQLRDCYRQGWEPDWLDHKSKKYCIVYNGNICNYVIVITTCTRAFLSFQSKEIAEKFVNNFSDLIKKAGELIE